MPALLTRKLKLSRIQFSLSTVATWCSKRLKLFMLEVSRRNATALLLFSSFNYYSYARNKTFRMSKGKDIFYFGEKGNPAKYDKKEIIRFVTSKVRNNKSPISGFAIVTIELKNGIDIQIPNLLVDDLA
jgi:hypothetical protein